MNIGWYTITNHKIIIVSSNRELAMFGQDFGHRLRELRLAQGLTKEKFCEGDEVLSVRQLTRIETGKSQPKLETLEHLARRLNISLSELLGESCRLKSCR